MFTLTLFLLLSKVAGYKLLPMWWNIGQPHQFSTTAPNKIIFNNIPLCIYYANKKWNIIEDGCPHRGASLSKGNIIKSSEKLGSENLQCIQCPYHGWEFDEGRLVKIPGFNTLMLDNMADKNCLHLKNFSIKNINGNLYIGMTENTHDYIYIPPEEFEFDKITESIKVKRPYQMVTENILDMSHISYIHSFGNLLDPDPYNIVYKKLSEYSGRTTFYYKAGAKSLSRILGNADTVIVENEYHLPSTTVTRVKANKITKTIVTSSYPITKDTTMLTYKLYRNYLQNNMLADMFHFWQMRLTLKEDIDMLANVYEDNFLGKINTKYDITQKKYRDALELLNNNNGRKRNSLPRILRKDNEDNDKLKDYIIFDKTIFPTKIKHDRHHSINQLNDYKSYSDFLNRDRLNDINRFTSTVGNKAYNLINNIDVFNPISFNSVEKVFNDIDFIAEVIKTKSPVKNITLDSKSRLNILSYNVENKFPTNNFNDYRAYGNFINAYDAYDACNANNNKQISYINNYNEFGRFINKLNKPKEESYNDYKNFGSFLGQSIPTSPYWKQSNMETYNAINDMPSSYN